ncbi:fatty acyl-AMP ligase [Nocardia sp. NBC_00565]|uniref:fatty acyl-AMP ligase n=1 Tax=Nocardia sp. NBC_00565 TaxID=2975993 RepID=UPI002E805F40|nr:fatty acyl-AMP ligase [Nocardia sp. NBC_00565]WUC02188.1 fatty acyl-AMP ligase [Nocardia sp. NBC_00565]
MTSPNTPHRNVLAARVAEWARTQPDSAAYTELRYRGTDCEPVTLTYAQLHCAAGALARRLRATSDPGDRVAILCAHGIDYVVAFLACLYSNRIAVPLFPPTGGRNRSRLDGVLADAQPALSLVSATDTTTGALFGAALGRVLELLPDATAPDPAIDDVRMDPAYLQYTSGSTKTPAGVEVTHANLAAALDQLWHAVPAARTKPMVSWLPFFHDMGLVLALSLPLYSGVHGVTMAPADFVKRPIRWLRALSDYRAGTTGGPNFGLALALSATTREEREGLDLSDLDTLLNGAEPIRADVLTDFTEIFTAHGFRHHAHTPGFGLAEATLPVTICGELDEPVAHRFDRAALARGRAQTAQEGVPLVGCGMPAGQLVAVVDPTERIEIAEGTVGEIWVSGPNVCSGYYNDPVATAVSFRATLSGSNESWLRTGDLGFWYEGQLYIAGRLKDLIIIDGRNHYPADIETTVADCAPEVRAGHVTAFGHDDGHREDLVVVAELADAQTAEVPEVARRIRNAIAATHEVTPGAVVLVEPGRIPKTSSGKLRRGECRALYGAGRLT